ncbi:MAG: efflux RND transporter periplasmic adaptor subunit [Synergistaceae bacterium]|nr:efflux RND transporter periplasmic adaptor subunit [Synergistaceae bacterium]
MIYAFLKKLNKLRVVFWLGVVVLGVVALGIQVQARLREAAANVASLAQMEEIRYPVTALVIEPVVWESWRSYYGQTKAARTQDVTSYVREMVQSVHVQVGDAVKRGDTVVTLLKTDHAVRAQASQTSYEEARLSYNRLLELSKQGGVPQADVDRAYVLMRAAEANAQSSRSTLQRTELKSSIDGVVAARYVEPGEVAEAGRSLVSIVDPSDMEAQLMVSKRDINNIGRDTPVELFIDEVVSRGQVKRLSPEAQAGSGLYPVVVGLAPNSGARPGTYLEGRFLVDRKEGVFVIPSDVVMYRGDRKFVYVVRDDKAGMVEISTGEGRDGRIVVTSGLSAGDQLIVSGNRSLFDGALISKSDLSNP